MPGRARDDNARNLFGLAVWRVLLEVSPKIADLLFVLDAGKHHLGARDFCARVADIFLERRLVPGEAGILVGLGIVVALGGARLAAIDPVELRADLVLGIGTDAVARQAFLERVFAGGGVLRRRNSGRGGEHRRNDNQYPGHDGSFQNPIQEGGKALRYAPADWMATCAGRVNGLSAPMFPANT